jgi:hypothetical protein
MHTPAPVRVPISANPPTTPPAINPDLSDLPDSTTVLELSDGVVFVTEDEGDVVNVVLVAEDGEGAVNVVLLIVTEE